MPQVGAGRGLRGLPAGRWQQQEHKELSGQSGSHMTARARQQEGQDGGVPSAPPGEDLGPREGQCVPGERPCPGRLLRGGKLAPGTQAPQSPEGRHPTGHSGSGILYGSRETTAATHRFRQVLEEVV